MIQGRVGTTWRESTGASLRPTFYGPYRSRWTWWRRVQYIIATWRKG